MIWLLFFLLFVFLQFRATILFKTRKTEKWTSGKVRNIMLPYLVCLWEKFVVCICTCVPMFTCACVFCVHVQSYWVRLSSKYKETGSVLLKGLWTNFTLCNMTLGKSVLSHSVYGKDIMADTFAKVRTKIMQRQQTCQFMTGWHQQMCLGSWIWNVKKKKKKKIGGTWSLKWDVCFPNPINIV